MKKNNILLIALILLVNSYVFGQQERGIMGLDNWLSSWTEFSPNKEHYDNPTQILTGNIDEDRTLLKREIYLLTGDVFVTDSTTLTIEPGTLILADYKTKGSLTITNGSKIMANGEETDPIVFTSNRPLRKAGDWGGINILGSAPINRISDEAFLDLGLESDSRKNLKYGGLDSLSNSGVLRHVRIEYAGRKKDKKQLNGLTLAGVGEGTIIDNVMVSYSLGNSFHALGGNLSLEKLVSYRSNRNDYSFKNGAQVSLNNSLAIRSPYVSSSDGFRSLYASSYDDKQNVDFSKPQTNIAATNISLINVSDDINKAIEIGLVKEAIYVKEGVSFAIDKSVISGFNPAVYLDEKIEINDENLNKIKFTQTYFNSCNGNIFTKYNSNNDDLENWYGSRSFDNTYNNSSNYSETFIDINNSRNPDYRLRINNIIATTKKE